MCTGFRLKPNTSMALPSDTPPIWIGSIRLIPCGPLVMFTGAFRLFMKIRTISPKPSVTIAR
ncbi:hypothetical protein D3C72_2556290 [compost metagenome]